MSGRSIDVLRVAQALSQRSSIAITPELTDRTADSLDMRLSDVQERFPHLVAGCPYETRLAVAA